jgi:hypothetical protein
LSLRVVPFPCFAIPARGRQGLPGAPAGIGSACSSTPAEMHTYISTTDLPGTPSLAQVLLCLAQQAREFDPEESLEDWASRINLEPKDQKTIDAHAHLVDQVTRLKTFFGTRGHNRLLYDLCVRPSEPD